VIVDKGCKLFTLHMGEWLVTQVVDSMP